MSWFGKAIGAAIGAALAGPWGGIIGAALGHQYDAVPRGGLPGGGQRARQRFFATTFEVMGHIAKIDGRVSEQEIDVARRVMQAMRLSPDQVQQAIAHFTEGKRADYELEQRLAELAASIGPQHELARAFLDLQVRAAAGAGEIGSSKRALLTYVAEVMGFERGEVARIEAALRSERPGAQPINRESSLTDAYRTLGVAPAASDRDVKTAYRRLMNRHHPDKLVSKGLPESMIDLAEKRTQQIRAAYDRIKDARGFK
jgi:DnaJ like chaperone protein